MCPKFFVFFEILQIIAIVFTAELDCDGLKKHKHYNLLPHGEGCLPSYSTPRIMGGHDAELGEFPWVALLVTTVKSDPEVDVSNSSSEDDQFICTGSIINRKYIITAGHCLPSDKKNHSEIVVQVGKHNLNVAELGSYYINGTLPYLTYLVEEYIPHPKYDSDTLTNDLILLRIKGELKWNDNVHPACLPSTCSLMEKNFHGDALVVVGYGLLSDDSGGFMPNALQKVTLVGTSMDECVKSQSDGDDDVTSLDAARQLCAGGSKVGNAGKDACHGDSGGPLIHRSSQGGPPARPYVVGLVSYGKDCYKNATSPGIYTKVAYYMPWILDNIRE